MLETEIDCIHDEDKVQSVSDTDDKFTECQTPRKNLTRVSNQLAFHQSVYKQYLSSAEKLMQK